MWDFQVWNLNEEYFFGPILTDMTKASSVHDDNDDDDDDDCGDEEQVKLLPVSPEK